MRITIRGYGARGNGERSNGGNMRGIRILTDGVPLTEPDGRTSLELVDLGGTSQVEVLRSNGSALYGNASGGVVNLRTDLDFTRPQLELQSRGGSFGFHREQAVAGSSWARRLPAPPSYLSHFDGWREHSESATTSIQNRLSAPLGDRTRLGVMLDFVSNLNRFPGPLTQAQLDADPKQASPTFVSRDERRFNRSAGWAYARLPAPGRAGALAQLVRGAQGPPAVRAQSIPRLQPLPRGRDARRGG